MTDCSNLPISAGLSVTLMPQASMTASFSCAVPLPPEMIAPACPIRFPGGAVTPAMKPTTGLFVAAADFSDHHDGVGPRVIVEQLEHVDVLEPVHWIAADAHGRGLTQIQ